MKKQLMAGMMAASMFGKGVIAFMQQRLQQRVLRVVRLQHHFALFSCASGTPRHLGIKLGEALGGAEICREQRAVNVQQGDQRDVREVMPFCQHLGANQYACTTAMHFRQLLFQRAFAAGGVPIDTRDRHVREEGAKGLFQLLRAQTDRHDMR